MYYTTNMKLYSVIENCYLDRKDLDDNVICAVIRKNYSNRDLCQLIKVFLKGIGNQHSVSGNVVYTLIDLIQWYQEDNEYTFKQQAYIILTILSNWDQINIEVRVELNL